MKKIILSVSAIIIVFIFVVLFIVFAPATKFSNSTRYLYITAYSPARQQIMLQLDTGNYIRNIGIFDLLARQTNAYDKITPGRFEIKKGENIFTLVRSLRNNNQSAVRLVINKLRTLNDFAKIIGKNFSTDSITALNFLSNNDSLAPLGTDTNTLMTLVIPDTYFLNWSAPTKNILMRLKTNEEKFWSKDNRLQKAASLNLTPGQVYTLASIVEEETNKNDEKGNVASVYYNRLNQNSKLQADPTIKFAMKDFSLKRIYSGYLSVQSPYNTYMYKGLPPGPICTPSKQTIDAVLNMPKTDYLFFVAKSDFSGYHQFSSNYAEHQKYAQMYQQALNEEMAKKNLDSIQKTQ